SAAARPASRRIPAATARRRDRMDYRAAASHIYKVETPVKSVTCREETIFSSTAFIALQLPLEVVQRRCRCADRSLMRWHVTCYSSSTACGERRAPPLSRKPRRASSDSMKLPAAAYLKAGRH